MWTDINVVLRKLTVSGDSLNAYELGWVLVLDRPLFLIGFDELNQYQLSQKKLRPCS